MDRLDAIVLPSTPTTALPIAEVDEGSTPAFHTRFVSTWSSALRRPAGAAYRARLREGAWALAGTGRGL
jgi:hypothetical protein